MKHVARTRHLYREVAGVRLHYREAGLRSPTAALLLHGFPSSSYSFRAVLPVLGEHVYTVAPDLPGFGFSDAPPPEEYTYTFERLSLAVEALVAELGIERYVLYETDWGTPVATTSRSGARDGCSASSSRTATPTTPGCTRPGTGPAVLGRPE